jgi:hypothetical protein
MKQYVIDELRSADYEKIKAYLDENYGISKLGGVYWIPLDTEMLTETQASHAECRPYYFALELGTDLMACELLVRSKSRMRCNCIGYATEIQRNWLIAVIDAMFENLGIIT